MFNYTKTRRQYILAEIRKRQKLLKKWLYISLLNVLYKLASSVITNRINTGLDSLIHEDQNVVFQEDVSLKI